MAIALINCGGSAGGTETGTTNSGVDVTNFSTHFQTAAYELVPEITSSLVDDSLSADLKYVSYGDSDLWDEYLDGNNSYVITDVFGSSEDEPQVVTKIRVLLDGFEGTMSEIFELDPDMDCSTTTALNEGDTIEVAYYGDINNGTSDDRYFDCVYEHTSSSGDSVISYESVTIYGIDSDGVVRIVTMTDSVNETPNSTETRGNTQNILSVIMATYNEEKVSSASSLKYADDDDAEEEDVAVSTAYLDLQYNQATLYVGVDETADTADDVYFKSRSRITGRVEFDEEGKTLDAEGDFSVIKYDRSINDDDSVWSGSTATMGRGGYSDDEYSIFKISTDMATVSSDGDDYFCLEGSKLELPSPASDTNCADLETAYSWGDTTFPFTLSPAIAADFETREFFDTDDLIESDGSDFEIPSY